MIELQGVTKVLGKRIVVDDFSLKVERGERLVLFGPSGSGKSTILFLIAGLHVPDQGKILIDGKTAALSGRNLLSPHEREVGMVFQDLALWPHMTVAQNIAFGLSARRVAANEQKERVQEIVNLVGLGDYLSAHPGELSGGEQQRVALARALVLRPRILLMDEALSSLDEALSRRLRAEILRLHTEIGFTLVSVTHSRDEAQDIGTRTVFLERSIRSDKLAANV
ncbi:MAG: ABC transporter ATP-binding protein [Rhodospirillaceae bacterium]